MRRLALTSPCRLHATGRPGFLLQTVTSFLRPGLHHYYGIFCHLAPHRKTLKSPLGTSLLASLTEKPRRYEASPVTFRLPVNDAILNHATGYDQVSGFALCSTLTHPQRRIRFACAMCRLLPIASFRPCRCQQRPCDSDCLPPDRGDARFLQQAGFASSAGQTTIYRGYYETAIPGGRMSLKRP